MTSLYPTLVLYWESRPPGPRGLALITSSVKTDSQEGKLRCGTQFSAPKILLTVGLSALPRVRSRGLLDGATASHGLVPQLKYTGCGTQSIGWSTCCRPRGSLGRSARPPAAVRHAMPYAPLLPCASAVYLPPAPPAPVHRSSH